MKVLLIVSSYVPNTGGLQTVTRQLAKELHDRGNEVSVITNRYPRTLAAEEVLDDVRVTRWHFLWPNVEHLRNLRPDLFFAGLFYLPLTFAKLLKRLRRDRPDVVNLHFVGAPAVFVLLARHLTKFNLVVSLHGDDVEGHARRSAFDRWMFRSILQRTERVTACSNYLLTQATAIMPSIKAKAVVIHNAVGEINIHQTPRTNRIVAVGRMMPTKGFDVLLRACAAGNRMLLTLVGDGPELEGLKRLKDELGLNGEVRFAGNQERDETLREISSADFVVIPSRMEAFGMVALEAMSRGKPVVATNVGGLPEFLSDADAILVEPERPELLAAAMKQVQRRLDAEPTFGQRNSELAAQFTVERMANGYVDVYGQRERAPRVAFMHPFLSRYARGIERFTFELANELAGDADVHLVTWNWKPNLQIGSLDANVRIHRLPTSRYFAAKAIVPFYARHLRKQRYDFVWINFACYGEAEALRLVPRQRFGIVFHFPLEQVPHRYEEFKRSGLADRAEVIVSVSEHVAKGVREYFGRDSVVIHHGVDTDRFKADAQAGRGKRQELGLGEGPLLVTAAALEPRKGIQWVLRALPKVLEQFPDAVYLVLGEGNYRVALEELTRQLGIEKHVRFMGEQEDVTPFFQAADISLMLSRGEASSLTTLESLACELPVIVARRPPFDELMTEDHGILVDEEDTKAVAVAIENLIGNPEERKRLGANGRAHVLRNFTWHKAAEEYRRLMKQRSRVERIEN